MAPKRGAGHGPRRSRVRLLILVHGEGESRAQLAAKLATSVRHGLHMPALGESLALQ